MTAAVVIRFNNLLTEAGHAFAAGHYERAQELLAEASAMAAEVAA